VLGKPFCGGTGQASPAIPCILDAVVMGSWGNVHFVLLGVDFKGVESGCGGQEWARRGAVGGCGWSAVRILI